MSVHNDPKRTVTIDETTFVFLWYHTAGMIMTYFGAGGMVPISDAQRLDSVERLGRLYQKHRDALTDKADLVMDHLVGAAEDLAGVTGH